MKDLYRIGFQPYVQYEMILEFMRHWFQNLSGNAQGVIVGMSGGKDSTIAAYLWAKAIGKDKVLGVMMPDCNVDQSSISQNHFAANAAPGTPMADALAACSFIGINSIVIPVGDIEKATEDGLSGKTDEDAFGFTYEDVDLIIMSGDHPNKEIKEKILNRHHMTEHKRVSIPHIIS